MINKRPNKILIRGVVNWYKFLRFFYHFYPRAPKDINLALFRQNLVLKDKVSFYILQNDKLVNLINRFAKQYPAVFKECVLDSDMEGIKKFNDA